MKNGKKFFVGGIMNLAAGLGQAGYGLYQERQAKKKMAQADEAAMGPIRSQAARQRIARQESDAQSAIDAALRAQATAAEQIAQQGGARALVSATPGLMRATDLASQRAIAQAKPADESVLTEDQNLQARLNMNRLARAADAARTTTLGGIGTALSGAAEIAGGIDWSKIGKKGGAGDAAAKTAQEIAADASMPKVDVMQAMNQQAMRDVEKGIMSSVKRPIDILEEKPKVQEEEVLGELDIQPGMKEEGGKQEPVEKTPGEFDHDENPIDIMQDGAKIGEMTGGEYIFNPEQAEEMRKLSEEGDSELHQFIRNLLSKEQFQ